MFVRIFVVLIFALTLSPKTANSADATLINPGAVQFVTALNKIVRANTLIRRAAQVNAGRLVKYAGGRNTDAVSGIANPFLAKIEQFRSGAVRLRDEMRREAVSTAKGDPVYARALELYEGELSRMDALQSIFLQLRDAVSAGDMAGAKAQSGRLMRLEFDAIQGQIGVRELALLITPQNSMTHPHLSAQLAQMRGYPVIANAVLEHKNNKVVDYIAAALFVRERAGEILDEVARGRAAVAAFRNGDDGAGESGVAFGDHSNEEIRRVIAAGFEKALDTEFAFAAVYEEYADIFIRIARGDANDNTASALQANDKKYFALLRQRREVERQRAAILPALKAQPARPRLDLP